MRKLAYSARDAARELGCGRDKLYAALASGALVSHRVGVRRLIWHDDLERWLKAQPTNRRCVESHEQHIGA